MQELTKFGAFCWKNHGSEFTMAGLPDIACVYHGKFFGFETKRPGERDKVSAVQKLVHEKIRAAGGVAEVICTPEEAINVLNWHS